MVTRVGKEDEKDERVKKQSRNRAILCCLLAIDGHFAWMAIVTSGSGNRNPDTRQNYSTPPGGMGVG